MEVRVGLSARWVVSLAPYDGSIDEEAMNVELLAVLTQILLTSTLLPTEPFMTLVEESFKGGLTHELAAGRPYDEIADLRAEESYTAAAAHGSDAVRTRPIA